MHVTCRPISNYPWPETPAAERRAAKFRRPGRHVEGGGYIQPSRTPFEQTLRELANELEHLGADAAVLEVDLREDQIRIDGWPKATATPTSPRVVLSFHSTFGPLRYATDRYDDWRDNLRAITVSLENLRAVDRHGVTRRGEQYQGWNQLPAKTGTTMDTRGAAKLVMLWGDHSVSEDLIIQDPAVAKVVIREASRKTHPDAGGTTEKFQAVQEAKRILSDHHGQQL